MNILDLIWGVVSFLLTLMVLSYIFLGDNPLFRLATYILIGVAAAYIALVTFNQVIWPRFFTVLLSPTATIFDKLLLIVPVLLCLLLLFKLSPRLAFLGNPSMGFLVGVGAAVIVGGAVLGTLFPQAAATAELFDVRAGQAQGNSPLIILLDALVILVGSAATLLYFQFGARPQPNALPQRPRFVQAAARVGQVFLAITLGSLFAGVYIAALTALIDRIFSLINLTHLL